MLFPKSFRSILVALICFLTACSENPISNQQQNSQMRIQLNENMGMVGTAWKEMFDGQSENKKAKNLSSDLFAMDFTQDDENFAHFISSLKDIDSSNQSADFKARFKEDLAGYHSFWQSNLNTLNKKQKELQKFCDKYITDEYLDKIRKFYKSKLQAQETDVYLVPLLDDHNAESFYIGNNMIFLQVMPCNTVDHIGVMLHEFFHINYDNSTMRLEMEKVFKENHAEVIHAYMNEALAVAGGNILTKLIFEGKKEKEGFACDVINQFGIALAPLVKSYIDNGKSLDHEFFEQSIKIFKAIFPDYQKNIKYRLIDVRIYSSDKDEKLLQQRVFDLMQPLSASNILCASIQSYGLNEINLNWPESAKIILLKNNENLKGMHIKQNEFAVRHTDDSAIQIIIKSDDPKALIKVIKRLLKMDIFTDLKMTIS